MLVWLSSPIALHLIIFKHTIALVGPHDLALHIKFVHQIRPAISKKKILHTGGNESLNVCGK